MPRALIRPVETRQVDVQGESLEAIQEQLRAELPEGFMVASAPVQMSKSETDVHATGTYVRQDGVTEIEVADIADARAKTPEGWQVLCILP